jgi:hypothetical protein
LRCDRKITGIPDRDIEWLVLGVSYCDPLEANCAGVGYTDREPQGEGCEGEFE